MDDKPTDSTETVRRAPQQLWMKYRKRKIDEMDATDVEREPSQPSARNAMLIRLTDGKSYKDILTGLKGKVNPGTLDVESQGYRKKLLGTLPQQADSRNKFQE